MAKTVLRLTHNAAAVKVYGATETIDLQTDLLKANEELDGATQRVSIYAIIASGAYTITRNSVIIFQSTGTDPSTVNFNQFEMKDTIENASDIVVTVAAGYQVYLQLRKESGYKTKFEPEQFGSHDDPTQSGS